MKPGTKKRLALTLCSLVIVSLVGLFIYDVYLPDRRQKQFAQLTRSVERGDPQAVKDVMSKGITPLQFKTNYEGSLMSPLHQAAGDGKAALVGFFIDFGIDPNLKLQNGMTPLIVATQLQQNEVALLLLNKGADANIRDKDEGSALLYAAGHGSLELVKALLEKGADANNGFAYGPKRPLVYALSGGYTKVVEALLASGAKVHIWDADVAESNGHKEIGRLLRMRRGQR